MRENKMNGTQKKKNIDLLSSQITSRLGELDLGNVVA